MAGVAPRVGRTLAWRLGFLLLSLAVLGCNAQRPRVRKELRLLTTNELNLFVQGLTIMIQTSQEDGQAQYGEAFREYDYFVVKHAIAVLDPRGDQGHFGPCFITYHRALTLEFENSLLSVVPQLGAMPYWDVLMDVRGSAYPRTHPKYMYSSAYAGTLKPGANTAYTVQNGLFAWRQIPTFNWDRYGQYSGIYSGSSTGLLRGPSTNSTQSYVTRYFASPFRGQVRGQRGCYYTDPRTNEFNLRYSTRDWQFCLNPNRIRTMMDWHWCIDINGFESSSANTPGIDTLIRQTCSFVLHPGAHFLTGGQNWDGNPGDFNDIVTAPNEVLLFFLHHANIDRNFMIWQRAAARLDPYIADPSVMWHYPSDPSLYQDMEEPYVSGCYLYDTVNANMPFTDIFPGQAPSNPDGYTHFDVLWNTRPGAAPYSYDNLGTGRGKKATTTTG